jgi:hypothetical protein
MQPGVYADTFFIFPDTDGVPFSPRAVAVFLEVQGDMAVVIAEPDNFSFNVNPGDTLVNNSIFVYEQQGQNILFATEVLNTSPWLQLQYDSLWTQTTPSTVFFDLCTGGLGAGIYVDTIVVFYPLDDIYGFADVIIPVTLTVSGDSLPYELRAEPMSFNFQLQPGESAYDTLFVYEANDRMIGFYYYNNTEWLAVNPLGMPPFVTPMPLPIAVSTNQLDVGFYVDTIFVHSDYEPGYPQTLAIPVYLAVGGAYMAGDANADEVVNIGDALYIVNYIFRYGPPPEPLYAADVDCNGLVNVGDVVNIIIYIFREGPGLGCH